MVIVLSPLGGSGEENDGDLVERGRKGLGMSFIQSTGKRTNSRSVTRKGCDLCAGVSSYRRPFKIRDFRGTHREYSSKPLKHSMVKRILLFKR